MRSLSLLCGVISGISRRSSIAPGIGTQITPLEWRIVNAISSGRRLARGEDDVALVLAVLVVDDDDGLAGRDVGDGALDAVEAHAPVLLLRAHRAAPSCFCRCGAVVADGAQAGLEQLLDVLGEDVDLEVDPVAGLAVAQGGAGEGLGDQADREAGRSRPRRR